MATDDSFSWPNGAKGAVSLSFDDGVETHVTNAIPTLDKYGIPGTFYVPMAEGGPFDQRLDHWREAAKRGHEIGNHSMTHPCSANYRFRKPWLDDMTLGDVEAEIVAARKRIVEGLPDQKDHSFAYPCGETKVGRGESHTSYVPVVAQHYVVGRGIGDAANDPILVDLACVWSFMPADPPAAKLVEWANIARNQGKWVVYCFHGVGGQHFLLRMEAFRILLDFLTANARELWTDTVIAVGTWVRDQRT